MTRRDGLWAAAVVLVVLLACSDETPEGSGATGPVLPTGQTGGAASAAGTGGTNPPPTGAGMMTGADTNAPTAGMAPGTAEPAAGTTDPPMQGMDDTAQPGMAEPGDDGPGASADGPAMPTMGSCGPEVMTAPADLGNTDTLGPWTPMHVENTGPNGSSWIYYPQELGQDGLRHPVFQWGPGAGTGPSNYLDHLNLLASHGFVIISQPSTQSGREALTWILEENDSEGSMWYQKLDPDRVGRGGHSMGALQSMSEADDPRLKLYVLVCGGANGNGGASDIDDPTIFLGGEGLGDTRNFEPDYQEVTGPAVFIRHGDTDHIYCARDNLGPWVAFMRWQFCGEEKWKAEFDAGGTYCTGEWGECETKNL